MPANQYEECLSYSKELGLELDPRVQRKQVNGIYGMYATEQIPEGTVFASFPLDSLIPISEDFSYSNETSDYTKRIHAAAIALSQGKKSESRAYVMLFETIDEYRDNSVFYFSDDELALLSQMNPLCHARVMQMRNLAHQVIDIIKNIDPELDENCIIQAVLNSYSRSWDAYGFIPIMDLFNHSHQKGSTIASVENTNRIGYKAKVSYSAGDQLWISYGPKDLYTHAVYFNYFDPTDTHFIDYGLRAVQTISNSANQAVADYIATIYDCQFFEQNGEKKFRVVTPNLLFLESGPSKELMAYFSKTSFCSGQEFSAKKCSSQSVCSTLIYVIDSFLSANKVDSIKLTEVPKKLHRFHQLLKKEKKILLKNREWVMNWASKQT